MSYNIADWYWIIGGDNAQFWSSAKPGFVGPDDPGYRSFLARGYGPTPIATLPELIALFYDSYKPGSLWTYANQVQWDKATGGYTVTVGEQPVSFKTTSEGMSLMTGKSVRLMQPDPPESIIWQTGLTDFVVIPAADFLGIAVEIADFVQSTFDLLEEVIAEIDSGQITSRDQIDAIFA